MLFLLPAAFAGDMSWRCDDTATLPEDVVDWKDATGWPSVEAAWDEAYAWYDPACVTCVGEDELVYEVCEAVACVTSAGAVLDYRSVTTNDGDTSEVTESITVRPPSGTWTSLTVDRTAESSSSSSSSGGTASTGDVAWSGTLFADWPVDGAFSASTSEGQTWYGMSRVDTWDDGACAWRWSWSNDWGPDASTLTMGAHTFALTFGDQTCGTTRDAAWVDDVYVGVPDEDTWALIAGDDDGDGWSAGYGDCDDADATAYPCGTDTPYDGVDGDCDGASDYDADGDGHDADAYGGDDCDDADAGVYPGASDTPYDGIDGDCSGGSDFDADLDGHDADAYGGDDCDDTDAAVSPDAVDADCDGVDQDCDGADACGDTGDTGAGTRPRPDAPASDEPARGCGGRSGAWLLLPFLARRRR